MSLFLLNRDPIMYSLRLESFAYFDFGLFVISFKKPFVFERMVFYFVNNFYCSAHLRIVFLMHQNKIVNNYLNQLNEVQKEAVLQREGPMIIIAGAGSGKTRVLTYRIAHLMKNEVDPFNILSLTFTNKAAREMKTRIADVVGQSEAKNLWMGTFHSVFARILRSESDKIGFPSNFTIYDTQDSVRLLSSIIKELNLRK